PAPPGGRLRTHQLGGGEARPGRARGDRAGRLHRGGDRPRRRARPGAVRGAGADPRGPRRRPLHARDVLRPRRARAGRRGPPLGLLPPDRRADELRQRRDDAGRRDRTGGRGAAAALAALEQMSDGSSRLAALPNVGLATFSGARVAFPHATPEYFAEFAARARALGARIVGGCCGTTPAQIAAVRGAIDEGRVAAPRAPARAPEHDVLVPPAEEPTELARLLAAGEFVVSVQLDPPLGGNIAGLVDTARRIREAGVAQLVDVNDNPRARARMSGIIAAAAIRREAGIEVLPHL